jgi:hypothetical protein
MAEKHPDRSLAKHPNGTYTSLWVEAMWQGFKAGFEIGASL